MQLKGYVTDLVFQIIGKNWNLEVLLWTFSVAIVTAMTSQPALKYCPTKEVFRYSLFAYMIRNTSL